MATQYRCKNRERRKTIIGMAGLNGIDYLEVAGDQRTLQVHCVNEIASPGDWPATGTAVIAGGVRVRGATLTESGPAGAGLVIDGDLRVIAIQAAGKTITVTLNRPGDFSPYTLRLIASPANPAPPVGFDRQLSEVEFSFKVDCPGELDCRPRDACPTAPLPAPEINYLAKDYASFRRLLLDRLSLVMPAWQERNPADVEVMLVELLAYVGDRLSYYQDAVAGEAYLGTARTRSSVRRHARLLDYFMHDGCNARAWVCFDYTGDDPLALPQGTQLVTRGALDTPWIAAGDLPRVLAQEQPEVFETLHPLTLESARSAIPFHTWGDSDCCLPAGATRATLRGSAGLHLSAGDLLVFEEVRSPTTGLTQDADPRHRHAVRLTFAQATEDALFTAHPSDPLAAPLPRTDPTKSEPLPVLVIAWSSEDALPFALCLSGINDLGLRITDLSLARANCALADHGLRVAALEAGDEVLAPVPEGGTYRPRLRHGPLTQQGRVRDPANRDALVTFAPGAPAAAALTWAMRDVAPCIRLFADGAHWTPQRDLLGSDRFATELVAEVEHDGTTWLRFGDNTLGQRPAAGTRFTADYRVGNGVAGNVGAGAIARAVEPLDAQGNPIALTGLTQVWNPLPAVGGVDPETMEQVRQYAPQAFRVQERAVTPADYVEVTQRRADVQRAAAQLRWTGSWYTAFATVDRLGGLPVDAPFAADLRGYLNGYRLAGYDLEINGPLPVPLDLVLHVCVKPDHFRSDVKQALLGAFSNRLAADGQRGFFHPDNFTFGQPLYASRVYQAALAVDGVQAVQVQRLQRWGKLAQDELEDGMLRVGPYEVIRLDNDANFPENGQLAFLVEGGL